MSASANPGWILAAILTCAAVGCGSNPPRDQNYGTNLGADFRAPVVDAHADATADAGAAGAAGGEAGASNTAGSDGAAGANVTGVAGTDGAAGAGGTGA